MVRHGETVENANRICQGHNGGHLSETGIEQARKLAFRLKDRKIDAVYASDLKRAADTAREIMAYHPELETRFDQRIRERCFGEMQGKPMPADFDWDNLPSGVETIEEMCARTGEFLEEVIARHSGEKTVLVVCHGGVKRSILTVFHGLTRKEYPDWDPIKNASVTELEIDGSGRKLALFNCVKHLEG